MRGIILNPDSYTGIKRMTQEQKGDLLDIIFTYNIDGIVSENMDQVVGIAFDMMRDLFDRQRENFEKKAEISKQNGKTGGRPKRQEPSGLGNNPEEPSGLGNNPEEPSGDKGKERKGKEYKKDTTIVVSKKHEIKENSFEEAEIFFEKLKTEIKENINIEPELIKFYNYWKAPMKSGKEYWTTQKTFAFRARLTNWLDKTNKKPNTAFINNKPQRGTVG